MNAMIGNSLLLSSGGYQISRSVRLRSDASATFTRTPASNTNRRTWTWSAWLKRGLQGTNQTVFAAGPAADGNSFTRIFFFSGNQLTVSQQVASVAQFTYTTNAVYRDSSAWYHIVLAIDTTQATSTDRVKLYVNGQQVTSFSTATAPTLNLDTYFNSTNSHVIGNRPTATAFFDGYLTEINFIDGQALTPASFGQVSPTTGVWEPIKYTGTYGTNGFYLNFSDNSAATAAAIGKDYSGNGNNWTPNNISVTAGSSYDSMLDVPTPWPDGGNGRGNYATLNPNDRDPGPSTPSGVTGLTRANLRLGNNPTAFDGYRSTIAVSSGKWYVEADTASGGGTSAAGNGGLTVVDSSLPSGSAGVFGIGASVFGQTLAIALDLDAGSYTTYRNNSVVTTGSITVGPTYCFRVVVGNGPVIDVNFGQRPFAYTPPTGFSALNTLNLPTPTIANGAQYFDATTYTATGTTPQTITNSGGMQPNLLWTKPISSTGDHALIDSARGVSQYLISNLPNAEASAPNYLLSFNSNGFSLGSANWPNGTEVVGWQWKETPVAGFDIVLYTGTGVARTIAHNLGVAPKMLIVKNRTNATAPWRVWHSALAGTEFLSLNTTDAKITGAAQWNSTTPTSTVFSVGTSSSTNENTAAHVAYLFAEVAGFSRISSYTGNGSADGPFVFCGFRPRFLLIKNITTAGNSWIVYDTAREPNNLMDLIVFPDLSNAESVTSNNILDILSNGFKIRGTGTGVNTNANVYIFAAFAENPFKYALAR